MSTSRNALGFFGAISSCPSKSRHVVVRARHRDWDGVQAGFGHRLRPQSGGAGTEGKFAARTICQPGTNELTADRTFAQPAEYRLAVVEMNSELAGGTRWLYRWNMEHLVLPHFVPDPNRYQVETDGGRVALRETTHPHS